MKKYFIGWLLFMSLGVFSLYKLAWHPFIVNDDKSVITLRYKDVDTRLEIEKYSSLERVLEDYDVPDDVDIKALNPLQILKHNDLVILPILKETPCISLNTGSVEDLMALKGIGAAIAQRIIDYRTQHGLFQSIDEIKNVKGIGPKVFEKLKDDLCI
jgi:competence protein ComEA